MVTFKFGHEIVESCHVEHGTKNSKIGIKPMNFRKLYCNQLSY